MTKEDLLNKTNLSLTMKQLREFVNKNTDIKDDAPVLIERVEDSYFEGVEFNGVEFEGWDVLKVEGVQYHSQLYMNNKMTDIMNEQEMETFKEEFYIPNCITTDKEIIYIYSHY